LLVVKRLSQKAVVVKPDGRANVSLVKTGS